MGNVSRRVAVTGAAGYIGGRLLERLQREDSIQHVLAMDLRPLKGPPASKVVFHRHDVTDPLADILEENGIDSMVHLAFVLQPAHNWAVNRRVNVGGAANALEACVQAGVRHFLYFSSTTIYGAWPGNPSLLTEESPVAPIEGFQYGHDKVQVEALIAEFTRQHPERTATVLRGCPVMGPHADNFIVRAFSKPFLAAVRGHDPGMQLLHEDDLIEAMLSCLLLRTSGVYNVAGHGVIDWSDMVRLYGRKLLTLPAPLLYGITGLTWILRLQGDSPPSGLDFIRYRWAVSTEKIERELGIKFRFSSRDAWEAFVRGRVAAAVG